MTNHLFCAIIDIDNHYLGAEEFQYVNKKVITSNGLAIRFGGFSKYYSQGLLTMAMFTGNKKMDIDRAKGVFYNYVGTKHLRDTNQRELILAEFLNVEGHVTVDDLYNLIKQKNPKIGYATVYRTLNLMAECGLASRVKATTGKTLFEHQFGHRHHDHLICTSCGQLIEVCDERIEQIQTRLALQNKFYPQRHQLTIYGLCKNCK